MYVLMEPCDEIFAKNYVVSSSIPYPIIRSAWNMMEDSCVVYSLLYPNKCYIYNISKLLIYLNTKENLYLKQTENSKTYFSIIFF